jgi:DNA helicase MCM8
VTRNNFEIEIFDIFRSRLKLDPTSHPELLPIPLLRKYIAYAREYVHPEMNEQAKEEILKFYVELRQTRFSGDSITITHRQLESLLRLTEVIFYRVSKFQFSFKF